MGIVRGYCRRSSGIVNFWFRRLGRRLRLDPRGVKQDKLAELVASFAEFFNSLDPQQHQRMHKMWRKLHRYSGAHPA